MVHDNDGLRKLCDCARQNWPKCQHSWHFNFKPRRGAKAWRFSLDAEFNRHIDSKSEAEKLRDDIRTAIRNGTYVRAADRVATTTPGPASGKPTFAMVADAYANDAEGLVKLSEGSKRGHRDDVAFLATVTVPPGVPFTAKPFDDIIRPDIKLAIVTKSQQTEKTYHSAAGLKKGCKCGRGQWASCPHAWKKRPARTWTRTVGGTVSANRLHNRLQALWNWAIEEGYPVVSPFIRARKGKNRLKHDEHARDRRLRGGEETALLDHANEHLKDVIVAALEAGMRKGEILSLQWKQIRWLQNDIHLPGLKTKTRRDRRIPITPPLREVLTRRQTGTTKGPKPLRFQFGPEHYVFGDEIGQRVLDVRTAWENAVLKAHGVKPERTTTGALPAEKRAKLAEIDLNFHDLRHESGSRKLEGGWPLHAVSAFLGHANVTTTARYLNVKDDYLQELTERQPLTLVQR